MNRHHLRRTTVASAIVPSVVIVIAALCLTVATTPGYETPSMQRIAAPGAIEPNTVTAYGTVANYGPTVPLPSNGALIDLVTTDSGHGYWLAAGDGGVFSYGDAAFHGSMGGQPLNAPIVAIASVDGGSGYWLVASDGGVFSYGDALFFGSMGGKPLNAPVVDVVATPSGHGYWLIASDGGIFAYGDAPFLGSMGGQPLNRPMARGAGTSSGHGYWMAAIDGGVFSYGDATFLGSEGEHGTSDAVTGFTSAPNDAGYWMVTADGHAYAYGVDDLGSAGSTTLLSQPVTSSIEADPASGGYWLLHGAAPSINETDSGTHVRAVQQRLVDLGYWLGAVDGHYSELTRQAVYAFDKIEGLPIDGATDGATLRRLDTASRPSPTSANGDLLEVDKTRQVLFVVRGGATQWMFNVSTGTERPYAYGGGHYLADTPTGHFTFAWQVNGVHVSNLGRMYRPKFFETTQGIAVHGYTDVPSHPASHGCVRVTNEAIDFIWNNDLAPIGSAIWVYGTSPT